MAAGDIKMISYVYEAGGTQLVRALSFYNSQGDQIMNLKFGSWEANGKDLIQKNIYLGD